MPSGFVRPRVTRFISFRVPAHSLLHRDMAAGGGGFGSENLRAEYGSLLEGYHFGTNSCGLLYWANFPALSWSSENTFYSWSAELPPFTFDEPNTSRKNLEFYPLSRMKKFSPNLAPARRPESIICTEYADKFPDVSIRLNGMQEEGCE